MRFICVLILACLQTPLAAQEFATLKGHGGPIMGIAVSPQDEVGTASFDNSVGRWAEGRPTWLEGHEAAVTAITFDADGQLITGGDDFTVRIWGDNPRELGRHKGKVASVSVSPDGAKIASGSWDGSIRLWDKETGDFVELAYPGAGVNSVAFSEDGQTLFAATSKGEVLRYALPEGTALPLVKHGFGVNRIILGEGWLAYGAVDGGTRVIDAETGQGIADFTLDRRPILSMAYHKETGQLAAGDGHGYIMMLDTHIWEVTRDFRATRHGPVWALAFSVDGSVIHAGGLDDVAYSWPVALLSEFDPAIDGDRSFLRDAETMPNGERQFMRKCSICHALEKGPSRKAGPTLYGVFGRPAGTVEGYRYSEILDGSDIIWSDETIDALFDIGPDHYIPGSKMPMQVIAGKNDRADLISFLKTATKER